MAKLIKSLSKDEQTHIEDVIAWTLKYYIFHIFPWMYEIIKMKTWYKKNIENEIRNASENKDIDCSYHIYPIIEPNIDAFNSNSYEIDTMWRVIPYKTLPDSIKSAKDASDYISWLEWITNWKDIEDVMRYEATTLWTSYCKAWTVKKWNTRLPYWLHVPFFELFCEPWAQDFYEARFKIHRKIYSEKQIDNIYWKLLSDKNKKKYKEKVWECFSNRDFNKIRELKLYEDSIEDCYWEMEWSSPVEKYTQALSTQFSVIDWENENHEVVEIWEEWVCHLYINHNYMCSYEEYSSSPFWYMVFEKQPWTYMGRWLWHKLMSAQLDANFVYNSLRKAIRQDVHPDTMSLAWALIDPVTGQAPVILSYQWGKNYSVNWTSLYNQKAFEKIQYASYDTIAILEKRLNQIVSEAQMTAGTSSYTLWGQWKVERVSGGVAQKNSVFLARLQPLTSSIKSMKSHLFYIWMEIAKKIDKEIIFKISDSWEDTSIESLNIDDILDKTYVALDTETNKAIRRYEEVELGTKVLWVLSPMAQIEEAKPMMLDILKTVVNNYAVFKNTWELAQETKQNSESLMKQAKWLEDSIATNNMRTNNMSINSILSQVPSDESTLQSPWNQDF